MPNRAREKALEGELLDLYKKWAALPIAPGKKRRWYANYIRQMFTPGRVRYVGGVETVKHVIGRSTTGLGRLSRYPQLTVERYIVLSGRWDDLFNDDDRLMARKNLATIST